MCFYERESRVLNEMMEDIFSFYWLEVKLLICPCFVFSDLISSVGLKEDGWLGLLGLFFRKGWIVMDLTSNIYIDNNFNVLN